jgi:hypothetical protein
LAIFSFGKTLVQNAYSVKNPMTLFSSEVVPFLDKVCQNGSIVIIENKFSKSNNHQRIKKFHELIKSQNDSIEFMAFFITSPNKYKKPNTNILSIIENVYETWGAVSGVGWLDKKKSIVIGAHAGRYGSLHFCADDSDIDRAFAHNLGINTFRTPEDIFLNMNLPRRWSWKGDHVSRFLEEQKNKVEPKFNTFIDASNYNKKIVFVTGAPASGKTLLARRIFDFVGRLPSAIMLDINTSTMGGICEALSDFNTNDNVILIIVDVLYDEIFSKYCNIVIPSIDITCVELDSSRELCIFLDRFRLQTTKSPKLVELKKEYIALWFLTSRKNQNRVKYVQFPLVLRTRSESFFRY